MPPTHPIGSTMPLDQTVPFATDTATLAIFDPEVLRHRLGESPDWWCEDNLSEVPEVRDGRISLLNLRHDSSYEVRVTDGELTCDERDYAAHNVRDLGLEVTSGSVFVGPGECIPSATPLEEADVRRGALIQVPHGQYSVDAYGLFYAASKKFWKQDLSDLDMELAPCDFVVVLRSRAGDIAAPNQEPCIAGLFEHWVFPSSTREVGPEPGMILTTLTRRNHRGELVFEACGPGFYSPENLEGADGIEEWDYVSVKVGEVDHEAAKFRGTILS
ncbi:MAG: DUF6386 family protein [Verrucomicrobiota bacterium]